MDISRNLCEPPRSAGWKKPLPERMPRPTYWPAMLALSTTLSLLGPVTSIAITVVGLGLGVVALIGWIGEIFT